MNIFSAEERIFLIATYFILHSFFCGKNAVTTAEFFSANIVTSNPVNVTIPELYNKAACKKDDEGEGILIDRIIYRYQQIPDCYREITTESLSDIAIRQTLQRDCNGKDRCYLSDGIWLAANLTCGSYLALTNRIEINIECMPIKPDDKHVFRVMQGLSRTVTKAQYDKSYLVLDEKLRHAEIHCEIDGNRDEMKFTLLYVDFGSNTRLHGSDTCHGYINVTKNKTKTRSYTCNGLPKEKYSEHMRFVSFDVSMSKGLVWIELDDYKNITIKCKGMDKSISTTLTPGTIKSSTSEMRTTTATAWLETTVMTSTTVSDATTRKLDDSSVKVDEEEEEEEDNVPAQSAPLEIVIPVSAAGLLTMIVLAVCVACACSANSPFRRWKRRRRDDNQKIRYHKHDEYDYVTTDEVLDCTPGSVTKIRTKKYVENENYARDCDYAEIPTYEETSLTASPTSLVSSPTSTTPLHRCSESLPGPPLTPVRSSRPATNPSVLARSSVTKIPDGPREAESAYSTVIKKWSPVVGPSMLLSSINAPNFLELADPPPPLEQTEYSHLNHSTNQRNFENVYDG